MPQYRQISHQIEITVEPTFLKDRSNAELSQYFWAYQVFIKNLRSMPVQLLIRYWHITDSNGHIEEVNGEGVIGQQPMINPNESFQYTSGCPLTTPSGIMYGHYIMKQQDGEAIIARIPAFSLDSPWGNSAIH